MVMLENNVKKIKNVVSISRQYCKLTAVSLFACVDALHPSQQFFSHVGAIFLSS